SPVVRRRSPPLVERAQRPTPSLVERAQRVLRQAQQPSKRASRNQSTRAPADGRNRTQRVSSVPAREHRGMADDDLEVTPTLRIPGAERLVRFTASGGPGVQHANKAATRVELTFDPTTSSARSEGQRNRIVDRIGPIVRIVVDDERSQLRNREIAEAR